MSLPLEDFRGKITAETAVWLEARSRITGKTQAEILRDVMHRHVMREIHEASLLTGLLQTSGLAGPARDNGGSAP